MNSLKTAPRNGLAIKFALPNGAHDTLTVTQQKGGKLIYAFSLSPSPRDQMGELLDMAGDLMVALPEFGCLGDVNAALAHARAKLETTPYCDAQNAKN